MPVSGFKGGTLVLMEKSSITSSQHPNLDSTSTISKVPEKTKGIRLKPQYAGGNDDPLVWAMLNDGVLDMEEMCILS